MSVAPPRLAGLFPRLQHGAPYRFLGHAALLLSIISFVGVVYVALLALFIGSFL